jgi:hypothetical protein
MTGENSFPLDAFNRRRIRFQCSAQPLVAERPVKSKKKLMNIEHRTSNIEHRIMYFVYFIERLSEAKPPFDIRYSAVLRFAFIVVSYKVSGISHKLPDT